MESTFRSSKGLPELDFSATLSRPGSRAGVASPSFILPGGYGKNAPARVRANPVNRLGRPMTAEGRRADGFDGDLLMIGASTLPLPGDSPSPMKKPPTPFRRATPTPAFSSPTPSTTAASTSAATGAIGRPIHVPYRPDLRSKPTTTTHTHTPAKPMTLRDCTLLAEACQRAGKARMEGHAYYKIGEIHAQQRETLPRAIPYFEKYLAICRRLNDLQGEAKALNCLGIVHQELGDDLDLERALEYHQQHSDIADAAGVFIANTNLGLIRGARNELGLAVEHHKQALQFAVRAQDKQAEALALANLSLMGRSQGDHATAKVCIERNLELSTALHDDEASCDAYEQLGLISSNKKEWATASEFLLQALDLSSKQGNYQKSNSIRCKLGFINGTLRMDNHLRSVAKMMGAKPERKKRRSGAS